MSGTCDHSVRAGAATCAVGASSRFSGPFGRVVETCTNASYVVTTPVVVGTNLGCHVAFGATLQATGAGTGTQVGETTEIEVGACAGLTLSNATASVTDNAVGTFVVPVRVVVTNVGWKLQGNLVAVNAATMTAVVLNVTGTIAPGCVRLRNGTVSFTGVFQGNYQFL